MKAISFSKGTPSFSWRHLTLIVPHFTIFSPTWLHATDCFLSVLRYGSLVMDQSLQDPSSYNDFTFSSETMSVDNQYALAELLISLWTAPLLLWSNLQGDGLPSPSASTSANTQSSFKHSSIPLRLNHTLFYKKTKKILPPPSYSPCIFMYSYLSLSFSPFLASSSHRSSSPFRLFHHINRVIALTLVSSPKMY